MLTLINLGHRLLGGNLQSPLLTTPLIKEEVVENPPFNFLALPLDLRLEIYRCIANIASSPYPGESPLYPFFFVSQQVRFEASSVFYAVSGLIFPSPSKCLSFLELTTPHIHFLTSLAISVPDGDTYSLEPIFGMLYEADVPIKTLVLDLQCRRTASAQPDKKHVLAQPVGEHALERARERAQSLETAYQRQKQSRADDLNSADDSIAYPWPSNLGKLKDIRFIAIDGNPSDNWSVEFELAVLCLHERMYRIVGNVDGRAPAWYGRWGDWYWFGSREVTKRGDMIKSLASLNPSLR
ncbi:uncharacterized protein LY89DRAFT_783441 [Mollisia scopiformis]|uniref:Uncharacterized protein n=1 Tax=Mollisia scopiformis TaxID=149040 RepID=A0A194X5B8_MOLSC|nr:uncharacterized protein LY89DRAFT_783441 [Mollisia scopiformis]KUJ15264.1 hypothetical protein LY89DRAFT_783441 [Mollisia scopiformis]